MASVSRAEYPGELRRIGGFSMRTAFCLLNDFGPAPTYVHVDGHRYMLVSLAADQLLAAIESVSANKHNHAVFIIGLKFMIYIKTPFIFWEQI